MIRTRNLPVPALAIAAVLALAGCGANASVSVGNNNFDTGKAETEIAKGVEAQNPGLKVKSVDCPDDIEAKKGTNADCTVTLQNGNKGPVHLTMTDDEGGFNYSTN